MYPLDKSINTKTSYLNEQPLNAPVVCLGDGHDGIGNLFDAIATEEQRQEILDWFHLVENLQKVGGSQQRSVMVEALLWQGKVDAAIEQFQDWSHERVDTFIAYLNKHRHRIVNYSYFPAEGISIGSGTIESTVKHNWGAYQSDRGTMERRKCPSSASAPLHLS